MIALCPEAERQIDALIARFEAQGRLQGAINLLRALERALERIAEDPGAGLEAPLPYPALGRPGLRWIMEGRYWLAYGAGEAPAIVGVFYDMGDNSPPLAQ